MVNLVATSPVGKNGQTVIPAPIRHLFKINRSCRLVGFFVQRGHVEIAPVHVRKSDYSSNELNALEKLTEQKKGVVFKSATAAKRYLKGL